MLVDHQVIASRRWGTPEAPADIVRCPVVHLVVREGLGSVFEAMVDAIKGFIVYQPSRLNR